MEKPIVIFIMGAICIVLGIINATGNISTIKYRHRRRVAPENQLAFGRLVGAGSILLGVGFLASGVLFFLSQLQENPALEGTGGIVMIIGAIVGLTLSFVAMIKYNKGIF
jgi:hypothetical protein